MRSKDDFKYNLVSDIMEINLNGLRSLIKDRIVNNKDDNSIIIIYGYYRRRRNVEIVEK